MSKNSPEVQRRSRPRSNSSGNARENPRYNVVSIRLSDVEKAALERLTRRGKMSLSCLMREAIRCYTPYREELRKTL